MQAFPEPNTDTSVTEDSDELFLITYKAAISDGQTVPRPTLSIGIRDAATPSSELSQIAHDAATGSDKWVFPSASRDSSGNKLLQSAQFFSSYTEDEVRFFGQEFKRCLLTVDDEMNVSILWSMIHGFALDEEQEQTAKSLGEAMRNKYREDGCAQPSPASELFVDDDETITRIAGSMVNSRFDASMGSGVVLTNVKTLYGLFFHPGGIWTKQTERELRNVFEPSIARSCITPDQLAELDATESGSFFEWAYRALRRDPAFPTELLDLIEAECENEDGTNFQALPCIENQALSCSIVNVGEESCVLGF